MASGRPLRVLSVLHSLEPGGVERDLLRFTRAWRDRGLDARIALGRHEGRLIEEAADLPFIIPPPGYLARIETESLWMMQQLPAIVREVQPDVLFFPSNGLMAVAAMTKLRMGRDCPPIILRPSNELSRGFAHRLLLRAHAHVYSAVVAMAPEMRNEILLEMGMPPDRVFVINNGAMTAAAAAAQAKARDQTNRDRIGRHFLGVGRLGKQKNFALLLRAFALIARPEDRLTVVGEGDERQALERLASDLGVADQFDLPGHQSNVTPWFAEADAFVLSSDFEGVPAVVIEALAAGIPIVATDCCAAMSALVADAGRLVPTADVRALAAAMDEIGDERVDQVLMRARAREFTIEVVVNQWIELLAQVARAAPAPSTRSSAEDGRNALKSR